MTSFMSNKLFGAAVAAATFGGAYLFFRNRHITRNNTAAGPPFTHDEHYSSAHVPNTKENTEGTHDAKPNTKEDFKTAMSNVKDRLKEATTLDKNSKTDHKEDEQKLKTYSWPFAKKNNPTKTSKSPTENSDEN